MLQHCAVLGRAGGDGGGRVEECVVTGFSESENRELAKFGRYPVGIHCSDWILSPVDSARRPTR